MYFDDDEDCVDSRNAPVCPNCGCSIEDFELLNGVQEGDLFEFECPHCGAELQSTYMITFHFTTKVKELPTVE